MGGRASNARARRRWDHLFSVEWSVIVMCAELFFVGLLCIPMPTWMRKPLLRLIASGSLDAVATGLKWVFGFIVILFLDSIRQTTNGIDRQDSTNQASFATMRDNQAKLFRAERNLY